MSGTGAEKADRDSFVPPLAYRWLTPFISRGRCLP